MALENVMAVHNGKVIGPPASVGPTWEDNALLGNKNLAYIARLDFISDASSYFTFNSDGTITCSGTFTSGNDYRQAYSTSFYLEAGDYILSGNPKPGSTSGSDPYSKITLFKNGGSTNIIDMSDVSQKQFTITESGYYYLYFTTFGKNYAWNVTYKPMISLATDSDLTYVPSAMHERGLSEKLLKDTGWIDCNTVSGRLCKYRKIGNRVIVRLATVESDTSSSGWKNIGLLPVGCRPIFNYFTVPHVNLNNQTKFADIYITYTGAIAVYANLAVDTICEFTVEP